MTTHPAPLDGPFRAALEIMLPDDPFGQHSIYYLYTYHRETLTMGIRQALDAAVEKSLRAMAAS